MPLAAQAIPWPRRPMIDDVEVHALVQQFGEPIRRTFDVPADGHLLTHRLGHDSDRRAEVAFVVQGPGEQIWLHTKHSYPTPMFRLLTGGIEWEESVYDALLREIDEETRLPVTVQRFLGLITYCFYPRGESSPSTPVQFADVQVTHSQLAHSQFASYVFLVHNNGHAPQSHGNEEVAEFRAVLPCQLPQIAADLRNLIGPRRAWGHWRALVHDLVYETLC